MKKLFLMFLSLTLLVSAVTPSFAQAYTSTKWVDIEEEKNWVTIDERPEIFQEIEWINWDTIKESLIEEEINWDEVPVEVNEETSSNNMESRFVGFIARLAVQGGKYVIQWGSKIFKKAPASKVSNALTNFKTGTVNAGSHTFKLTKTDIKHMLDRHHPKYWDGSVKQTQTFYNPNLSVDDVKNIALSIAKQNSSILAKKGSNATFQVEGTVDGVKYILGITKGHIKQLYPA